MMPGQPSAMVPPAPGGAPGGGPPPGAAPAAGPMSTPQQPKGDQAGANVDALMAQKILEKARVAFGSQSDEGAAILKAISALAKAFGKQQDKTQELMPA